SIMENNNLMKTIVTGRYVSLATLNQMKENDQKIIDRMTAPYVLAAFFTVKVIY
ncbi:MAG: hypothetical protein QG576_254, partial [Bacteroidota bacterium]|nr:hypothetical protein [Bacteroidota bacterium]